MPLVSRWKIGFPLALALVISAPIASAQNVNHNAIGHHFLGGASVSIDPTGALAVGNIGPSGADGVSINAIDGSTGMRVVWRDYAGDFAPTKMRQHQWNWYSKSGTPIGTLTVHINPDGSESVASDFSAVSGVWWLEVYTASGEKKSKELTGHVTLIKRPQLPPTHGRSAEITTTGHEKWIELLSFSPTSQAFEIVYDQPVTVTDGSFSAQGVRVRYQRREGFILELGDVLLSCATPAGAPPASFAIAEEDVTPPCAGLDCPNGPGTSTNMVVLGDATYQQDGLSNQMVVDDPNDVGISITGKTPVATSQPLVSTAIALESLVASPTPGAQPTVAITASGIDGGNHRDGWNVVCVDANTTWGLSPNFSSVSATGYRVEVSQGGTMLANVSGSPAITVQHLFDGGDPASVRAVIPYTNGVPGPMELWIICITSPCPGWPVTVGGASFVADKIRIVPTGAAVLTESQVDELTFSLQHTRQVTVASATSHHASEKIEVLYDGLSYAAAGAASVAIDPAHHLVVGNIGTLGNDGVEVELDGIASGYRMTWADYATDFGPSGLRTCDWHCTTGAGIAPLHLNVTGSPGGGETLTPDFSAVHPGVTWLEVLDATGKVTARSGKGAGYDVVANKKVLGAARIDGVQAGGGHEKWIELQSFSPTEQFIEVAYDAVMVFTSGSFSAEGVSVRMRRSNGDAVDDLRNIRITSSVPAGTPPKSFALAEAEVTPPCAGLDCPNGPGTGSALHAAGPITWVALGSYSDGVLSEIGPFVVGNDPPVLRIQPIPPDPSPTRPIIKIGVALDKPAPLDPTTPGSFTVGGEVLDFGTVTPLGKMHCALNGSAVSCGADFSDVNAGSYHLTLYRNGAVVGDLAAPPDGFTIDNAFDGNDPISIQCVAPGGPTPGPAFFRIICITSPCPGWPVSAGGALYLADRIDVTPTSPPPGSSIHTTDQVTALKVQLDYLGAIYVVGSEVVRGGPAVGVIDSEPPLEFVRPRLSPNPALGPVAIDFALPQAARAKVTIVDVAGRVVRALADQAFTAGPHRMTWDGRTTRGARAPAGVYFVRVESGAQTRVARLTRLW